MHPSVATKKAGALGRRFNAVKMASPGSHFAAALRRLQSWLTTDPFFRSFLITHGAASKKHLDALGQHIRREQQNALASGMSLPTTFAEHIAAILAALHVATDWTPPNVEALNNRLGRQFATDELAFMALGHATRDGKSPAQIKETVLQHLAVLKDRLDEFVLETATTSVLLERYKQRAEFFRRRELRSVQQTANERGLARDLYAYLHDQGLDLQIEKTTASGEPDLVTILEEGEQLILDAKYVHDEKHAKEVLTKGFRQVLEYCNDLDHPIGFLVAFVNIDVKIELKSDDGRGGFALGDRQVFYILVDIFEHANTASARPKPKVIKIERSDLVV